MKATVWFALCLALGFALLGVAPRALAEEKSITLDQAPAAVRAAIEQAVGDGQINEIEMETEDGKVVYEVEFVKDGKRQEAAFTEDGQPAADDEDDKGDKEDDDGDDDDDDDAKRDGDDQE